MPVALVYMPGRITALLRGSCMPAGAQLTCCCCCGGGGLQLAGAVPPGGAEQGAALGAAGAAGHHAGHHHEGEAAAVLLTGQDSARSNKDGSSSSGIRHWMVRPVATPKEAVLRAWILCSSSSSSSAAGSTGLFQACPSSARRAACHVQSLTLVMLPGPAGLARLWLCEQDHPLGSGASSKREWTPAVLQQQGSADGCANETPSMIWLLPCCVACLQ